MKPKKTSVANTNFNIYNDNSVHIAIKVQRKLVDDIINRTV